MAEVIRYQVDLTGLVGGPGLSTFHFDPLAGGYTPQDAVDTIEYWAENTKTLTSTACSRVGQGTVQRIDLATGQPVGTVSVTGFSIAGTASGDQIPPVSQGLIQWSTGVYVNGRELRGKTFMPCATETFSEGAGVPTTGYKTGLGAVALGMITADVGLCVYSRTHRQIAAIDGYAIWNQWAYLSGRRNG